MSFRNLVKKFIPRSLFVSIEPFGHLVEAITVNALNGFPSRNIKVIGVTGTNGKTTTAFLIHRMLHEAGHKVGLMSTVGYGVGDDIKPQIHHMTNVSVPELMTRMKWMKKQKIEWLVLETTSHALAQNRVWGVPYSIAVMTNITHEHLAYHRTFERYLNAKRKLFVLADKNKKGLRAGIINAEDPNADAFIRSIKNPTTYGIKDGDIRATDVKLSSTGVDYVAKIEGDTYKIHCQIPGTFNVYNSLAAIGAGRAAGLSVAQIEKGIAALESVEGRMTTVDEGQDFTVIVDYAHTPDSFEKVFKDIKPTVKGKMIVLFGSLGGGDKGKRPLQGKLAGKYADEVIICEEDDRQEDGQAIIEEIAVGVKESGKVLDKDMFYVHDRPEAIRFAFKRASKNDTVLLLGKGHEKTIEHADGEHPWNETEIAKETLRSIT
ncbi:MAG: UDP-N-acetylmuramoyl-L-alanyl-D-glutamate--2,6-diaminopimelate ligase [Candidatus Saccharimonadales bacterium]